LWFVSAIFYPSAAKLSIVELCVYDDGTLIIPALAAFTGLLGVVLIVPIMLAKLLSEYALAVIELLRVVTLMPEAACESATSLTTDVVTVPDTALDSLK
jgi:hypothetical protein